MKKLFILTALLCLIAGATAHAEIIDAVYTTDIGALIDFCPIKSYNISDSTYIKAEDLRGYGFDVKWNADARTLKITVNNRIRRRVLPEEEINIKKSDIPVHKKLYDVYSTDIKTYLEGEEIHACNIDGETLIKYRDMESVAYITYDDEKRLAGMDVISKQLDDAYNSNASGMTDLTLIEDKTYHGQVKDGKPDGIGKITDKSKIDYSPGTINDLVTTAYFADGEISGFYRTEGTYEETIGSSLGTYTKYEIGNTLTDYSVYLSDYHVNDGTYCSISTVNPDYANVSTGVVCRSVTDKEFLYGIKNTDNYEYTTYTNGDVDIEPLGYLPKFSHFTADYEASVITEDGEMFSLPYGWDYKHSVSALTGTSEADKKVTDGRYAQHSAEYDWLVTEDNKLYGFYYDRSDYRNPKYNSVLLAENIKSAQAAYLYVSGDGTLYEDMHNGNGFRVVDTDVKMVSGTSYVVYLKNDGSVWTYRSNSQKELGHEWNDGKDYSKPVKRAEDAVHVSGDSTSFMYIKNNGSLWAQGSSYNGEKGVIEQFNYDTVTYEQEMAGEAVKLGDGFVSCKDGAVSLALKENGDLYAWGENKNGIIEKNGGEYVLSPVKVAENVRDYLYKGRLYIIKTDGTLWYRGNKHYIDGDHEVEIKIEYFEQCCEVYKKRQHTVIPEPEQDYNSPYPPVPFNGRQYYVIYREGYRDNRIELAVFDITSTVDALEWDGHVLGDVNKDGSYVNDIKYYLTDSGWVQFEQGYERVSNNATEILDSNIEIINTAQ